MASSSARLRAPVRAAVFGVICMRFESVVAGGEELQWRRSRGCGERQCQSAHMRHLGGQWACMRRCACVRKASSLQLGGVPQELGGGGKGELGCERGGVKKGRVHVRACGAPQGGSEAVSVRGAVVRQREQCACPPTCGMRGGQWACMRWCACVQKEDRNTPPAPSGRLSRRQLPGAALQQRKHGANLEQDVSEPPTHPAVCCDLQGMLEDVS